jgi:hypothetical protein
VHRLLFGLCTVQAARQFAEDARPIGAVARCEVRALLRDYACASLADQDLALHSGNALLIAYAVLPSLLARVDGSTHPRALVGVRRRVIATGLSLAEDASVRSDACALLRSAADHSMLVATSSALEPASSTHSCARWASVLVTAATEGWVPTQSECRGHDAYSVVERMSCVLRAAGACADATASPVESSPRTQWAQDQWV